MKGIKKGIIIAAAAVIILLTAVGIRIAQDHSGKTYYTQIIHEGTATGEVMDQYSVEYEYHKPGFDENGNRIDLDFYSNRERALKKDAYLSIVYNEDNGVISYKEIKKEEIPEKAAEALEHYAS